jgi:hypothetical protein
LKNQVQVNGAYEIDDVEDNNLGMGGLQSLIAMKKNQRTNEIKDNFLSLVPPPMTPTSTNEGQERRRRSKGNSKVSMTKRTRPLNEISEHDSRSEDKSSVSNDSNSLSNRK